ncbi:3-dehydroquinate synthase AroB [Ceraceosorus guamensis]|uniref:3-dehydroquinate synthase n=1 Tax=Ceraceosorus guamensis TaxID=1522189 RepID=A0A316VRF6_9BASI|nr:3-dehydroquinate synthase AroB [Ceraceosorus guamensis]PWN40176.1 3-dehydroquinate synthase AroB [Ceraceosorus guamensis]
MADGIEIKVCLDSQIHIGSADSSFDYLSYIARSVIHGLPSSAYLIVTDRNVAKFHLTSLEAALHAVIEANARISSKVSTYIMPSGEATKTRETKAGMEDWMLVSGLTRDTVVIALGGGVVGDLVGFVAATYMRSVRLCHVPTTLLAMVDSSVGGKVAVDTPLGKNMIGAFHPAKHIFVFPHFLVTLPAREVANGMAEVIKTAAIRDSTMFRLIASSAADIWQAFKDVKDASGTCMLESRLHFLQSFIASSIAIKSDIVNADPKELNGTRNLVNFGHTIGHAIESLLLPEALHGEAIAVGMCLEARIAVTKGHLTISELRSLRDCLKAYDLPTSMLDFAKCASAPNLTVDKLLDRMAIDKKNAGIAKKVVLLSSLGSTAEKQASIVEDAHIAAVIAADKEES